MKTEKQFGLDVPIIEETIDESIFEIPDVDDDTINELKERLSVKQTILTDDNNDKCKSNNI